MNQELDKKLCEKYPKIFKDRNSPMNETCMCWGFSHGDGWYNIIDGLCTAMTYTYTTSAQIDAADAKELGIAPCPYGKEVMYFFDVQSPQAVADQVKEKFGTLRFYYHLEFDKTLLALADKQTFLGRVLKLFGHRRGIKKYPDINETVTRYSNYFDGIVHLAETLSGKTCEETGLPGELHVSGGVRGGWCKTLNIEYAKTDKFSKDRGYVPYSSLSKEDEP